MQTESVTGALKQAFDLDPRIAVSVLGVTCFVTIFGGLKRISGIMEKVVPFMAVLYILGGIGILLTHITQVPEAFWLIVKSAFTPMAGSAALREQQYVTPSDMELPGACIQTMPGRDTE